MVDGQAGPLFDQVSGDATRFSPDGKHFAYNATDGGRRFVVFDGHRGPDYDATGKGSYVFSSDSAHFAYAARKAESWFILLDGREGPAFDAVGRGRPAFSPNGSLEYLAIRDGALYRVRHAPQGVKPGL